MSIFKRHEWNSAGKRKKIMNSIFAPNLTYNHIFIPLLHPQRLLIFSIWTSFHHIFYPFSTPKLGMTPFIHKFEFSIQADERRAQLSITQWSRQFLCTLFMALKTKNPVLRSLSLSRKGRHYLKISKKYREVLAFVKGHKTSSITQCRKHRHSRKK